MQGNIKLEDLSKFDVSKPLASLKFEIIVKNQSMEIWTSFWLQFTKENCNVTKKKIKEKKKQEKNGENENNINSK